MKCEYKSGLFEALKTKTKKNEHYACVFWLIVWKGVKGKVNL